MGYPGEVDARGKGEQGNGRRRRLLGLRWSYGAVRCGTGRTEEIGWAAREEDLRYGGRMVWQGHEYFASALIYAILCAGSFTAAPSPSLSLSQPPPLPPPPPPCRPGYSVCPDKYGGGPYTSDNILRLSVFELFRGNLRHSERRCRRQREETGGGSI